MSYRLELAPQVDQRLKAYPFWLQSFIASHLERLAQSPTLLSRRAPPSTPGQMYEFDFDRGGVALWVIIVFQYGQDEQTLHVVRLTVEYSG